MNYSLAGASYADQTALNPQSFSLSNVYPSMLEPSVTHTPTPPALRQPDLRSMQPTQPPQSRIQDPPTVKAVHEPLSPSAPSAPPPVLANLGAPKSQTLSSQEAQVYHSDTPPPLPQLPQPFSLGSQPKFSPPVEVDCLPRPSTSHPQFSASSHFSPPNPLQYPQPPQTPQCFQSPQSSQPLSPL